MDKVQSRVSLFYKLLLLDIMPESNERGERTEGYREVRALYGRRKGGKPQQASGK